MEVCSLLCISLAVIKIKKFKNYFIIIWLSIVECFLFKVILNYFLFNFPRQNKRL